MEGGVIPGKKYVWVVNNTIGWNSSNKAFKVSKNMRLGGLWGSVEKVRYRKNPSCSYRSPSVGDHVSESDSQTPQHFSLGYP